MSNNLWVLVGLVGQAIFSARFLLQWLISEKHKQSIIPMAFWYLSIVGSAVLLCYAIYRQDPVFILGQSMGFFIYFRNIWLIRQSALQKKGDA
jgi:lipid-A-disaccharide synthase-like uncharacterized protein